MLFRWVTFALLFTTMGFGAQSHRRGQAARMVLPPRLTLDPSVIADPQQPDAAQNDAGSGVLRAQILLARQHFSCGELDARFGPNLKTTVSVFQSDRQLPVTGAVDSATWAALNNDSAPLLLQYTITADDVKGPWVRIPRSMMDQAKLPALGYGSPLEELSERFHSSPDVMKLLNPGADFGKAGQLLMVPNVLTMPPGMAQNVVVSRGESSVRAYDNTGRLIAFYMCTSGSEHDPLPIGDWKINGVRRNPEFHYNARLFWDAKDPNEKAVIKPGPNNPVGLVWMDLSKEHYGIHGTPEPSKIGHTYSHGCIRLTNWDAVELASMVQPGTPALLRE
jgi:lipoprotein-anchoring transpeptidase ErfK/SrfK